MLTAVKKHHVGPVHRADFLRRIQLRHQVPDGFEFRRADTNRSETQLPADYVSLLAEVKERVRTVRYAALKAVNKELVSIETYRKCNRWLHKSVGPTIWPFFSAVRVHRRANSTFA